jgi:hypothetical protein
MSDPYLMIINYILCYTTFFICYLLALAFIGVFLPVKRILLPVLIFSVIAYISKAGLQTSALVHTIVVVITCTMLLYLFNKIDIIFSLIGSLLSFTCLTLGSLLLACPLLVKLGYAIPLKLNGIEIDWLLLNLFELVSPTIILIILKTTKFSLMKNISVV